MRLFDAEFWGLNIGGTNSHKVGARQQRASSVVEKLPSHI